MFLVLLLLSTTMYWLLNTNIAMILYYLIPLYSIIIDDITIIEMHAIFILHAIIVKIYPI